MLNGVKCPDLKYTDIYLRILTQVPKMKRMGVSCPNYLSS